ncbi:hypothetical protein [Nonomuraea longicatena]|uniref:Uncharacterized protein n=1 Tax=Nonomuraea longicatena TaxID=83682 RepID=A0ABN1NX46_9ACTN
MIFLVVLAAAAYWLVNSWLIMLLVAYLRHQWWSAIPEMSYGNALVVSLLLHAITIAIGRGGR